MRKILPTLIAIILCHCLAAQNYVDIARLYYNTSAPNTFENSTSQTRVTEMGLDFTYPIVLNPNSTILTGFNYERTQIKLYEITNEEVVSSATFRIGLNKKHSDRLSGTYLIIPKLASDFEQKSGRNFQFGCLGLLRFTRSERFNYKAGLLFNTELFGSFLVPLLGLYYLSEDQKFEVNITLPSQVDLNYKLHKTVTAGFNFSGQIKSYHLTVIPSTTQSGYAVKTSNEICGYLKFNFSKNISLQSRVGYSVGRSYRVYDEDDKIPLAISFIKIGDHRQQLNTDFSNGLVYQAILLYRFIQD